MAHLFMSTRSFAPGHELVSINLIDTCPPPHPPANIFGDCFNNEHNYIASRTWDDVVIPQGAVHLYNKARTTDKDVIVYDELMHDLHNESGQRAKVCVVH